MESYATREQTIAALQGLGFSLLPGKLDDNTDHTFLDSPGLLKAYDLPVVQVSIYQCSNGYWCVDVEGGFRAPCVWYGPRADWDKTDTLSTLVSHLNKYYPGWR